MQAILYDSYILENSENPVVVSPSFVILKSGNHWPIDTSEINEGTDLEFQSKYRHLIDLSHITKNFSKEILGVISSLPDLVSFMSNGYLSKLDVKDCFNSMKLESDSPKI